MLQILTEEACEHRRATCPYKARLTVRVLLGRCLVLCGSNSVVGRDDWHGIHRAAVVCLGGRPLGRRNRRAAGGGALRPEPEGRTSSSSDGLSLVNPVSLDRLRAVFARLERIEGKAGEHSDAEWIALLSQRELADSLTDDTWLRGWLTGVLDVLGVSVAEALLVLRTESETSRKPRRRIVESKRTA